VAILACLVLLVYLRSAWFGFVSYDDGGYVSENPLIQAGLTWDGIAHFFYDGHRLQWIPLTSLSYMIECQLFGLHPTVHHLTNVVLHALNALLVYALLRRFDAGYGVSLIAAAIFAVHPLNVESVAWVSARKEVLYAFFWLLTIHAYLWYRRRLDLASFFVVFLLFTAGVASKVTMMSLPLILLLLDVWPLRRVAWHGPADRRTWKRLLILGAEKLPLVAMALVGAWWTLRLHAEAGSMRDTSELPLLVRLSLTPAVYGFFLQKFVWPAGLGVHYPYPEDGVSLGVVLGWLVLLGAVTVYALVRFRTNPALLVGWLWFVLALAPSTSLVRIESFLTADRYAYVPMIGLLFGAGPEIRRVLEGVPRLQGAAPLAATALVLGCAMAAIGQVQTWRNDFALWGNAVGLHPDSAMALNGLGTAHKRSGDLRRAKELYQRAIDAPGPFKVLPRMNLALIHANDRNWAEARRHLEEAIALDPAAAQAHFYLGMIARDQAAEAETDAARQTLEREAIDAFTRVIALQPGNLRAMGLLSQLGVEQPDRVDAHRALAEMFLSIDRADRALEQMEAAIRRAPEDAALRAEVEAMREAVGVR